MCLKGVLENYNIFIFVGKRARQVIMPEGVCEGRKSTPSFYPNLDISDERQFWHLVLLFCTMHYEINSER